jgi:hypothetical protein
MTETGVLKKLSDVCSILGERDESAKYLELYLATDREEKKEALRKKTEQSDKFLRLQEERNK